MARRIVLRLIIFIREVYRRMKANELPDMANALSFKLILSVFPFVIFFLSCIAYLDLDFSTFASVLENEIPQSVKAIFRSFVDEVGDTKHLSLLSSSLLLTVFSASSGLYTLMKGLNRAYGAEECRGYFIQRFISLILVIVYTLLIIISLYVCIFSDKINEFIFGMSVEMPVIVVTARSYLLTAALIFIMIILMYMLALVDRPRIRQLIPGTLFTMVGWLLLSKGFNIYVNNFSRYSTIYGSIGAIFIFALWLNLLSYALLIGGQINAVLNDRGWIREVMKDE